MPLVSRERNRVKQKFIGECLFLLFLCLRIPALADDSTQTVRTGNLWLNAGAGFGSKGVFWGVGVTVDNDLLIFSARFSHTFEFALFSLATFQNQLPPKDIDEVSLLVGWKVRWGKNHVSFSIGPVFVRERDRGRFLHSSHPSFLSTVHHYESVMISSLGVSLEGQHYLRFSRGFGIGLTLVAVVSRRVVFVGGLLSIQLGNWDEPF